MNANMNPGARIPRNAIRVWQSDNFQIMPGRILTSSLRTVLPASTSAVHPLDWTDRAGYEALRETAEQLRRFEGKRQALPSGDYDALDDLLRSEDSRQRPWS